MKKTLRNYLLNIPLPEGDLTSLELDAIEKAVQEYLVEVFREKTIAEEKNVEYAKLVVGQAQEYAEKLKGKVLIDRKQLSDKIGKVLSEHRCISSELSIPPWKRDELRDLILKELLAGSRSLPVCEKCKIPMKVVKTRPDGCRYFECPQCGQTVGEETEEWFKHQEGSESEAK